MQIPQVSSNNAVVGNQPQTNTVSTVNTDNTDNTDKTQTSETTQRSNRNLNTDRVSISPEAQQLAQQRFESDGYGSVEDATAPNVPATPNGQATNGSSSSIPRGATGVDFYA